MTPPKLTCPIVSDGFDAQLNQRFRILQIPIEIDRLELLVELSRQILLPDVSQVDVLVNRVWVPHFVIFLGFKSNSFTFIDQTLVSGCHGSKCGVTADSKASLVEKCGAEIFPETKKCVKHRRCGVNAWVAWE